MNSPKDLDTHSVFPHRFLVILNEPYEASESTGDWKATFASRDEAEAYLRNAHPRKSGEVVDLLDVVMNGL